MVKIKYSRSYVKPLILLAIITIPLLLGIPKAYAVNMDPQKIPEDVIKGLGINLLSEGYYKTNRWDGSIKIKSIELSPIQCEDDKCYASLNLVLEIEHIGDLSGYPTKDKKDWYEPAWNIFFRIAIKEPGTLRDVFRPIDLSRFYGLKGSKNLNERVGAYYWIDNPSTKPESFCAEGFKAQWIKRTSNINTIQELITAYYEDLKPDKHIYYRLKGELSIKCDKYIMTPSSLSELERFKKLDKVIVYVGIIGWTSPGAEAPGGNWLIAYDKKVVELEKPEQQPVETQPETTTKPQMTEGFEKKLEDKVFTYHMRIDYEMKGRFSGKEEHSWLKTTFTYNLALRNISRGEVLVEANVENLQVDSNDPEVEEVIKSEIKSLEFTNRLMLSDLTRGVKGIIEGYMEYQEQTGLEGLVYEVDSSSYNGIPAIKVHIHGEGKAHLSGVEEAYYKLEVIAYYDEYLGIPLNIKSSMYLKARSGEDYAEGTSGVEAVLVKGIENLPKPTSKPGVLVDFGDNGVGVVKLTAANAKVLDVSYEDTTLTLTGEGTGSLLLELPGNIDIEEILVDNEPADYVVLVSTPSETVILVPVTLSEHSLTIDFSSTIISAQAKRIQVGEEVATEITTIEKPQTSPKTTKPMETTEEQATTVEVVEKPETTIEEPMSQQTEPTTDTTGILPLKLDTTMMLMIVAVVAIIIAIVAVVIAVARR